MPNILDYLTWRGDVPFSVSPPNEVDNYIHCKIGTLDFTGIVPENELYVPLPQAGTTSSAPSPTRRSSCAARKSSARSAHRILPRWSSACRKRCASAR